MSLVKEQDGRKVKKQEKRGMRRIELCKRRDEETDRGGGRRWDAASSFGSLLFVL